MKWRIKSWKEHDHGPPYATIYTYKWTWERWKLRKVVYARCWECDYVERVQRP